MEPAAANSSIEGPGSAYELTAADNTLTLDFWEQRWTAETTGWHEADGHPKLWNNFHQIMKDVFPSRDMKELKVFVPLCGKAKDMYRFYQLGFSVVGIEYAAQPIREFFEENSLSIGEENKAPFTKSADGRMIIGQGDLFSFTVSPGGGECTLPFPKYDVIWDRGSFEAMNDGDRAKYATLMRELLADDGVYLIGVCEYDRAEYKGPPLSVSKHEITRYFGSDLTLKTIETEDMLIEGVHGAEYFRSVGLTSMTHTLYQLRFDSKTS